MKLTLTCGNRRAELSADDAEELAAVGEAHAELHGHTWAHDRRRTRARIRSHNAPAPGGSTDRAAKS